MIIHPNALPAITFAVVLLSWIAFATIFVNKTRPPESADKKRDTRSIKGIVVQGLAFAVAWGAHRPYFTPIVSAPRTVEIATSVFTMLVAISSVAFTKSAVRALGKEWSLTARVLEGHRLATNGPYAWVRHPIYTAMLGMLIATGLATSYWPALLIAIVIFFIGTVFRLRVEEGLLHETFGAEFDAYARRVSAIVPGIY
jgi:protein-S-isoprenylcysteine O-methyltransferase Ste14